MFHKVSEVTEEINIKQLEMCNLIEQENKGKTKIVKELLDILEKHTYNINELQEEVYKLKHKKKGNK